MDDPRTLTTIVLAASGPAVVLAVVFGLRDGVRAIRRNAFVSLPRYFGVYLGVPVVALSVLVLPVIGVATLAASWSDASPGVVSAVVGGGLTLLFLGIEARAVLADLRRTLAEVDVPAAARRRSLRVVASMLGVGVIAAAAAAAAVAPHAGRSALPLAVAGAVNLVFVPWVVAAALRELGHPARAPRTASPAPARGARRPSVLLISIDTLRADRLTALGGSGLMPALDHLAAAGVCFETAIAQSSWTLPSVASFLTGLAPSRHGCGWPQNGFDLLARTPLPSGSWTVAEALRADGYRTSAVVSNPYLARQYGLAQGFDDYLNVSVESELLLCLRTTLAGRLLAPLLQAGVGGNAAVVTARALRRLRALQAGRDRQPYFLWLHYIDPHAPYGCGGAKSFRGDTLASEADEDASGTGRFDSIARLRAGEVRLGPEDRARLIALYDAGVADVDRHIARVLAEVPPAEDVLVIVVSDHGEEFWEHGGVEHGHTHYEELVRVPLLMAGLGLPPGASVPGVTRLVDLAPTMLDLLHVPVPADRDGRSLVAHANGHVRLAPSGEPAVCESLLFADEKAAVRTDRYKYVRWANGKEELYDLAQDPAELRDLAAGTDLAWARDILRERGSAPEVPGAGFVDEEASVRVALGALGYL